MRSRWSTRLVNGCRFARCCIAVSFLAGPKTFDFTAALHSYWSISAVDKVSITGDFAGATFLDKTAAPPSEVKSESASLAITKEVDSVFKGVSGDVVVNDSGKGRKITVSNQMGWE